MSHLYTHTPTPTHTYTQKFKIRDFFEKIAKLNTQEIETILVREI